MVVFAVAAGCSDGLREDGETTDTSAGGDEQFTPVLMEIFSTPRWFTGSEGVVHLVYELQLTNGFPVPATVTEVEVRDVGSHETIITLSGEELSAAMSLMPTGTEPLTELSPSTVGIVWVDIPFDDASELPAQIEHELTVSVPPGLPVPEEIISLAAQTEVDTQPPTVIGPPLEGPGWLAFGSCCDGPHRRSMQPINNAEWLSQRYAIDFNKIDEAGMLATGDPSLNESWPTYDQPVLAVADSTVVVAVDGIDDQIPDAAEPVTIEEADGNYVILEIEDGVFAFYAHLKPGSVEVETGDTVEKGEVIGRTGNSGSSTGPHLHFQLMDRPSALVANGVPYVFDEFTVTGQSPPVEQLIQSDPQTDPVVVDTATAGPRTDELPRGRDVVEFASVPS